MKKYWNLLITTVLLISTTSVFADNNHYMIIVDAGSSGSRLHIFQYDTDGSMPVVTEPVAAFTNKTGLATYVKNPDQAGRSLELLLDGAKQFLAGKVDIQTVPVRVYGTAGMRLLKPEQEQPIYDSVDSYIHQDGFTDVKAETIPGKMEGFYGWADVNYLAGNFQNRKPTMGSIDMGGASTQIAYVVPEKNKKFDDDIITVNINNQSYAVFSKSFLGLGQGQSRITMMKDPAAASCFPTHYQFDSLHTGAFDFSACTGIFKNIIANNHVSEEILPVKNQVFYAYSGVYYTWNFFNVAQSPSQIYQAMSDVCRKLTWEEMQKAYPKEKVQYLSAYCSSATYESELLYNTYRVQTDADHLFVVSKINNKDVDWTLGAALYSLLK